MGQARIQGNGGAATRPGSRSSSTWSTTTPPRATRRARACPSKASITKSIDNASYYGLLPDQPRYYINDTGTGNTVNLSPVRVLQMLTDSLRYWAQEMRVDGFTLEDLVSYNEKLNEANGEENRDGTSDNRAWNCGAEGPTEDAAILALRARQARNFLARPA